MHSEVFNATVTNLGIRFTVVGVNFDLSCHLLACTLSTSDSTHQQADHFKQSVDQQQCAWCPGLIMTFKKTKTDIAILQILSPTGGR